jgi:tetratricopeptide (TPR) repeat protein
MRGTIVLVLVLSLAWAARVSAQEPPAAADTAQERKAKELYEQGNTHYDLAEYDQAIDLFKQAYALSRRPTLLYNIAQAYRLKGDCEQALQVYKNYLRVDPSSQLRAKVESRIAEMETCVKDPSRKPVGRETVEKQGQGTIAPVVPPPQEARPVEPPVAPVARETQRGGGTKKLIGLALGVVGVAAVGTGVYFSIDAGDKADQVAAACPMTSPCDWNDDLSGLQSDGEAAERNAIILYSVGAAALVGGGVMYYFGMSEAKHAPAVALVPARGGASLAAAWSF